MKWSKFRRGKREKKREIEGEGEREEREVERERLDSSGPVQGELYLAKIWESRKGRWQSNLFF